MDPATTPTEVNLFLDANFPGTGNECVELGARHAVGRFTVDPPSCTRGPISTSLPSDR
jgi:hypothetical protein